MPEILNMHALQRTGLRVQTLPETAVYIGRPSKWGNPFTIGRDGTREEVVAKYAEWIELQLELLLQLHELEDKDLVCWCTPALCHGEVLLKLVADNKTHRELGEI